MNERTHFLIKIYLQRVYVGCVWEVSWRREQTATYWPQVLLTKAALLSHPGWAAQPWVTEGPQPSVCRWLSLRHLVPNWNWLKPSVAPGYIIVWHPPASASSAYLHRCISWLTASVEGQHITGGHIGLKRCGNNNKDEDNSPKTLNDKKSSIFVSEIRTTNIILLFFSFY